MERWKQRVESAKLALDNAQSLIDGAAQDLAKKLGFKHAIGPAAVHDKFVVPVKDLRETLIRYVK